MARADIGEIKAGDLVFYVTTDGEILGHAKGRVWSVFRTWEGNKFADIEWDRVGMPKRLSIDRLIKVMDNDD